MCEVSREPLFEALFGWVPGNMLVVSFADAKHVEIVATRASGGGNRVVMRRVGYEIKWSLGWLLFF